MLPGRPRALCSQICSLSARRWRTWVGLTWSRRFDGSMALQMVSGEKAKDLAMEALHMVKSYGLQTSEW